MLSYVKKIFGSVVSLDYENFYKLQYEASYKDSIKISTILPYCK